MGEDLQAHFLQCAKNLAVGKTPNGMKSTEERILKKLRDFLWRDQENPEIIFQTEDSGDPEMDALRLHVVAVQSCIHTNLRRSMRNPNCISVIPNAAHPNLYKDITAFLLCTRHKERKPEENLAISLLRLKYRRYIASGMLVPLSVYFLFKLGFSEFGFFEPLIFLPSGYFIHIIVTMMNNFPGQGSRVSDIKKIFQTTMLQVIKEENSR